MGENMNKTFKELKEISQNLADKIGIDYKEAAAVVASFSAVGEWDQVDKIKAGDNATIMEGIKRAGVVVPGADNIPKKTKSNKQSTENKKTVKKEINTDQGGAVAGEIIAGDYSGGLDSSVIEKIENALNDYCIKYRIEDMSKARQTQWKAACMYIGENVFKHSKILHDLERERSGGIRYDVSKINELVSVWAFLCSSYVKAPFVDDFAHFAAISDSWLYGAGSNDVLTPERRVLLKKLQDMQESGLADMIADGRQNPTGALAILNHCHNWVQTSVKYTISDNPGAAVASLPVYDPTKGGLIAKNG